MEPNDFERWVEVQFYYICVDLLSINKDVLDLFDLIDSFAVIGRYDAEALKAVAQEALSTVRFRPSRDEFIAISLKFKVPPRSIKKRIKVHNRTLYSVVDQEKEDPRAFYARTDTETVEHMNRFVTIFNKLKKVGIELDETN